MGWGEAQGAARVEGGVALEGGGRVMDSPCFGALGAAEGGWFGDGGVEGSAERFDWR